MSTRTTVYRVRLDRLTTRPTVTLPAGARFVAAQRREPSGQTRDHIDLWAEVDPAASAAEFPVWIVGTGYPEVPQSPARHLDTVQVADGAIVLHVYVDDSDRPTLDEQLGDTAAQEVGAT